MSFGIQQKHTVVNQVSIYRNVNLLTHEAVIALQTNIPAQLEKCWTQEPATLDDALGRVTPIHLEFLDSWEVS